MGEIREGGMVTTKDSRLRTFWSIRNSLIFSSSHYSVRLFLRCLTNQPGATQTGVNAVHLPSCGVAFQLVRRNGSAVPFPFVVCMCACSIGTDRDNRLTNAKTSVKQRDKKP